MTMLQVSPIYIALGALLLLVLSVRVIGQRRAKKIGLGDGGDKDLLRFMRVHANSAETLPIQLLLLTVLELLGAGVLVLHVLGVAILLGRVLHAAGMFSSGGVSFGRFVGTGISLLTQLAMALLIGYRLWLA